MFSPGLEISHQWKFCHHQTGQFLASANYKSQRVPKFCFLAELCKKSFMSPKKSRWQFSRFYLHIEFRQNFYQQSTDALALPLVTRLVDNAGLILQRLRDGSPPNPKWQVTCRPSASRNAPREMKNTKKNIDSEKTAVHATLTSKSGGILYFQ